MDKLLRTVWNRDSDQIAEENPPCAIVVPNHAHGVSVACKVGLYLAILIRGRKATSDAELFGGEFGGKA